MTGTDTVIDQIVAAVLDQLRGSPPTVRPAEPPANGRPVELPEPVITSKTLEGRQIGSGPVVIGAKAVLTPSALDYLSARKIGWMRKQPDGTRAAGAATWLALVSRVTPPLEAALQSLPHQAANTWIREVVGCHREAANRAVAALCRGECDGAVIFTGKPESAVCAANRHVRVRAAAIDASARIAPLRTELGPNVWAVDPRGRSAFELRGFLRALEAGGRPAVPANWKE